MSSRALRTARVDPAVVRRRVGKNGEVVIPRALLRAIGLGAGDALRLSVEGATIRLERVVSPDELMGRLAGYRLVAALDEDHQTERSR
jgi:antitoxin component of MazEF toxin-antitoxin module